MDREVKGEWKKHAQRFAVRWLANMVATKRFRFDSDSWLGEAALLDAAGDLPGNQPDEVAKDVHLVGLAMRTDRRVLSLDKRQKHLLARLGPAAGMAGLHWASPDDTAVVRWLKGDAPDDPAFLVV